VKVWRVLEGLWSVRREKEGRNGTKGGGYWNVELWLTTN
jgi:hypothetical protein